ncbi:MAG: hypothetical protein QOE52_5722 [Mycobacterium sp.]|nr:hypothetical protein [Mycobacterium sp.]MDT5346538.1 hypothetical protein [Mycobacterium sp.]MDT7770057.1 hypothetical protein [Mycobacterium sp.]
MEGTAPAQLGPLDNSAKVSSEVDVNRKRAIFTVAGVQKTPDRPPKSTDLQWFNGSGVGAAAVDLGMGKLTITRAHLSKQSRSSLSPGSHSATAARD